MKSNRLTRLNVVSPFSLFLSFFLLVCDLVSPCLDGESSRGVESTRYGRVFQAGCRLPPPWINTRIARATSLSLSLAQPLLLSAFLSVSRSASRSPSANPQLLFVACVLSLSLLSFVFFSVSLSLFRLLSFTFSFSFSPLQFFTFSLFPTCAFKFPLLSFLLFSLFLSLFLISFYLPLLFILYFFLVIVLSFFPIPQSFSWWSPVSSASLSSLNSINPFVFISHIALPLFSTNQGESREDVRQPNRESDGTKGEKALSSPRIG